MLKLRRLVGFSYIYVYNLPLAIRIYCSLKHFREIYVVNVRPRISADLSHFVIIFLLLFYKLEQLT